MTRYLIDTNVILLYIRRDSRLHSIDALYNPLAASATSIISVVTEGELRSISMQRHWGQVKNAILEETLQKFLIADIHVREIINAYAEIDTYSQSKLQSRPLPMTARSMGKNDIWIAATASVLGLTLITTDKDFHHLNGVFLNIAFVDLENL
jgi:tRNA(fMet)-specific endonuclease VapC